MTVQGFPDFDPSIGTLDALPEETLLQIVRKLDLQDLFNLSSSSSFWRRFSKDHKIWELIAKEIGCSPGRDQVELFVKDLIRKVKIWCPQDLESIGELTISRIKHLQNFLIARDIIEVWDSLGHALDPLAEQIEIHGFDLEKCDSAQIIAHALEFRAWILAHQNDLDQVTELSLRNRFLTHIPKEIWQLAHLTELDLHTNLITSFPNEIANHPTLSQIDLTANPLNWDGDKKPLNALLLTDELLTSLPEDILQQIGCTRAPDDMRQLKDLSTVDFSATTPATIRDLVEKDTLTVEQFRTLCAWKNAAQKLVYWKLLAQMLNPEATFREIFGVDENHFNSAQSYLDIASHFDQWVAEHPESREITFEIPLPKPRTRSYLAMGIATMLAVATLALYLL